MQEARAEDLDVEVGRRIRELRKELGVPRAKLALDLGMESENVRHYESGRNMWKLRHLPVIADSLGVTLEELFIRLGLIDRARLPLAADRPSPGNTGEYRRTSPDTDAKALTVKTERRAAELVGAR